MLLFALIKIMSGRCMVACRGKRRRIILALVVVQRALDHRTVDVIVEEFHQHFATDPRDELGAIAGARR